MTAVMMLQDDSSNDDNYNVDDEGQDNNTLYIKDTTNFWVTKVKPVVP